MMQHNKIPHEYFMAVKDYFYGDETKAWSWFRTPNPNFHMQSPLQLIKDGKAKKVMLFIDYKLAA